MRGWTPMILPRLYPIVDVSTIAALGGGPAYAEIVRVLLREVGIVQLRAKGVAPGEVVRLAGTVRAEADSSAAPQNDNRRVGWDARLTHAQDCHSERSEESASPVRRTMLILNDRADLALLAGFDGCHLGQDDLSVAGARRILPRPRWLGLSTHNEAQVCAGDATDADYLAIGPIFATGSKDDAAPVIGLKEFVRLRKLTGKPVVAIGGMTRESARGALDAGADSVAMIGDLYRGCTAENLTEQAERNVADILARIL